MRGRRPRVLAANSNVSSPSRRPSNPDEKDAMAARIVKVEPFDLVVFGGTGDLAYRKLYPAK
jgi:hypothetical protein